MGDDSVKHDYFNRKKYKRFSAYEFGQGYKSVPETHDEPTSAFSKLFRGNKKRKNRTVIGTYEKIYEIILYMDLDRLVFW